MSASGPSGPLVYMFSPKKSLDDVTYGIKCSKISNTFLLLFSTKMMVIRPSLEFIS